MWSRLPTGNPRFFLEGARRGAFAGPGHQRPKPDSNSDPNQLRTNRERPHVVLGPNGTLLALTNGVTEAWPCTLQQEPDRPPCPKSFDPYAGRNPDCGPGSNGTAIWCPIDYSYTMWQGLAQATW